MTAPKYKRLAPEARAADDLSPIQAPQAPRELAPLIAALIRPRCGDAESGAEKRNETVFTRESSC